jgi:ribose transport system substrate-binding protein
MGFRTPLLSVLLATLGLSTCGCNNSASSGSGASKEATAIGQTAAGGVRRVILMTNGNSPYWDACRVGFKAGEKEFKLANHGLQAVMEVNDGTPQGQIDKLRQYASQSDIVAVGISVTDAANAAIANEMRALQKKGVHVLAIDGDVERSKFRDARFAFIGTDNLAAGRELGKAIKNLRPEGGEYVTFVGRTGAQNAIERIQGTAEGAGDKFKQVDSMGDEFDRSRAQDNVRNAIINHPKVNVLAGIWSYNGPAIVSVVRELGRRKDFALVTFDAEPISIANMATGELDCMVVQNPFDIGYQAARLMQALVIDDQATVKEMLPKKGETDGDLYETGLKLVVPDDGTPLKADMFGPKTEFLKLSAFKAWLAKYSLIGS